MAYESLYRRYRPQRFSQVRGQDHVVAALHNAVRENRVGHAYLLSGPRGTGKTSTARILAKALNCTDLQDGEPCGVCDSCTAIEAGSSYDLLELDAASNNGVDAMRDLIAKASLGSPGRTKVYLLDEVHMLSTGASNALLKTLEEPPGHVVFVLATTDPHKVLPTIRSRTQHFELHLLPASELRALVDEVVADAGLQVDEAAIDYALRVGEGSARDTLSALDQVVAAGGVLDRGDQVDALVDALIALDTGAALGEVAAAVQRGHDPRVVGESLLARLRDVFLFRMGAPLGQVVESDRERIGAWAELITDRACTRALEAIGEALRDMRSAPDTRIPLEVALVQLARVESDTSLAALAERVARLERNAGPGTTSDDETGQRAPSSSPPTSGTDESSSTPRSLSASAGAARPGDAARAALRSSRERTPVPSGAASTPSRAPGPPPEPPSPRTAGDTTPTVPSEPRPATAGQSGPLDDRSPVATAPPEPSNPSSAPSIEQLESIWTTQILPTLSGLTKAMFSVGHFVAVTADSATFAVPNEVHRNKSSQKLAEVEAAMATPLGHPLRIELVVEGQSVDSTANSSPGSDRPTMQGTEPDRGGEVDEIDDIGPVEELENAPNDTRSVTQRVVDTFPGAEVVDN